MSTIVVLSNQGELPRRGVSGVIYLVKDINQYFTWNSRSYTRLSKLVLAMNTDVTWTFSTMVSSSVISGKVDRGGFHPRIPLKPTYVGGGLKQFWI